MASDPFKLQPDGSALYDLGNGTYIYTPPDAGPHQAGDQSQVKIVDAKGNPVPGFDNASALKLEQQYEGPGATYGTHEPGTGSPLGDNFASDTGLQQLVNYLGDKATGVLDGATGNISHVNLDPSGAQATQDSTQSIVQQLAARAAATKSGAQAQADVNAAQQAYAQAQQAWANAQRNPLDVGGLATAARNLSSAAVALSTAQKALADTPVAPTVNAVQTGPQTLAQALQAAPVTSATAAQIGAIPQVVAPTIGPAPTAQAFGATGYTATGSAAQGFGATAGQAVASQLDPTQQAENRAYQENLIQSLQGTIAGNTPSVADLQLRATEQRQAANQLGIAAAASGGGNSPLALRTAANNIGRLNQSASADAALLRAQEIATAQGQLGGVADQARTGDINLAGQNASLKTGVSQTNAQQQTAASVATAGNLTDASKATASNLTAANIASAGNLTDASKATAANQTSTSQANANNLTALLAKQADLQYQASHDNAGNQLTADQTNANLATNVSLANALAQNTKALQDAKLATDVSQTNANNATNLGITNAGFLNDANKTNATNFLNQEGIDNTKTQNATQDWLTANSQAVTGQGNLLNALTNTNKTNADIDIANKQGDVNIATAFGQATQSLKSDRRAKTDVADGRADAQTLLDALSAKSFRYKDPSEPGTRPGRQTGVMAQDVERAPAGRSFVRDTPTGKVLDPSAGFGTVLSMLAQLNDRLNNTEGRRAT